MKDLARFIKQHVIRLKTQELLVAINDTVMMDLMTADRQALHTKKSRRKTPWTIYPSRNIKSILYTSKLIQFAVIKSANMTSQQYTAASFSMTSLPAHRDLSFAALNSLILRAFSSRISFQHISLNPLSFRPKEYSQTCPPQMCKEFFDTLQFPERYDCFSKASAPNVLPQKPWKPRWSSQDTTTASQSLQSVPSILFWYFLFPARKFSTSWFNISVSSSVAYIKGKRSLRNFEYHIFTAQSKEARFGSKSPSSFMILRSTSAGSLSSCEVNWKFIDAAASIIYVLSVWSPPVFVCKALIWEGNLIRGMFSISYVIDLSNNSWWNRTFECFVHAFGDSHTLRRWASERSILLVRCTMTRRKSSEEVETCYRQSNNKHNINSDH